MSLFEGKINLSVYSLLRLTPPVCFLDYLFSPMRLQLREKGTQKFKY